MSEEPEKLAILRAVEPQVLRIRPYQPGLPQAEVRRRYHLDEVIKLASNENPLGPGSLARRALAQSLEGLERYPEGDAPVLKQVLAEHLGIDTGRLVIGNGSNDILELAARLMLRPGRNAVFSEYGFVVYRLAALVSGAEPVEVPATAGYEHDLAAMTAAVTADTGVLFIASPNNPTGTYSTEAGVHRLLEAVSDRVLVVLDEAYCEYVEVEDYPDSLALLKRYQNLLVTRTFSKVHGLAGLRIGYGIGHPQVIDLLNRIRQPFNANLLAQTAAVAALRDREHIERSRDNNREGMAVLCNGLDRLGLSCIPSVANFVTVDVGARAAELFEALLQRGLTVRALANEYSMPNHLRITIGTPVENRQLLAGLTEILAIAEPTGVGIGH